MLLNYNNQEIEVSFKKLTPYLKLECEKLEQEYNKNVQNEMFRMTDTFKDYVPLELAKEILPLVKELNELQAAHEKNVKSKKKHENEFTPEQIQASQKFIAILEPYLKPIAEKKYKYNFAIDLAKLLLNRQEIEGNLELIKAISSENNSEFWLNQYLEELNTALEFFRKY